MSMIPIFPFFHTPDPGLDIPLDWRWSPISLLAHKIKFYTRQIENNNSSWCALKGQTTPAGWSQDVRFWLETAATQGDFMYSARTLRMIGSARGWIIDQASQVTGIATKASITVLDRLAGLLHQGALASKDLAIDLSLIMRKIFRFLGRPWINGAKLTAAFVRWTLNLLLNVARSFAYRALTSVEFY